MQASRIHVVGSSPVFHPLILEEELEASKKIINNLKEQLAIKDAMFNEQYQLYKKVAEEHDAKVQAWTDDVARRLEDVHKKHLLMRKAADDEIVRLRNERDRLVSVINEAQRLASATIEPIATEPKTKKARLDGSIEFDSSFFDEASTAWNQNKRRQGAGWVYKCIVPKCEKEGECDFDMCCYECFDKVCRNGSCKIKVTSKKKRGYCNDCYESLNIH